MKARHSKQHIIDNQHARRVQEVREKHQNRLRQSGHVTGESITVHRDCSQDFEKGSSFMKHCCTLLQGASSHKRVWDNN